MPLQKPSFHFFLGKGGVGRSTVAMHYALTLAEKFPSRQILFLEFENQNFLAQLYKKKYAETLQVGSYPQLRPNLWAHSLDAQDCLREYLYYRLKVKTVVNVLIKTPLIHSFFEAAPGLDHMVKMGKIFNFLFAQYMEKNFHDEITDLVIDFPATGHGIYALNTPESFAQLFKLGSIHKDAQQISEALHDPDLSFLHLVSILEELPVTESIELFDKIQRSNFRIACLWLNQILFELKNIHTPAEIAEFMQKQRYDGSEMSLAFEYERYKQEYFAHQLFAKIPRTSLAQIEEVAFNKLNTSFLMSRMI